MRISVGVSKGVSIFSWISTDAFHERPITANQLRHITFTILKQKKSYLLIWFFLGTVNTADLSILVYWTFCF